MNSALYSNNELVELISFYGNLLQGRPLPLQRFIAANLACLSHELSRRQEILSNYRAAKLLGVSRSHLGKVLRGLRSSRSLMARYQDLLKGHAGK